MGLSVRAVVLSCLLATGLAAPASGASRVPVPDGFLGAVAGGPVDDGRVDLGPQMFAMRRAGAQTVGRAFDWLHAQPEKDGPIGFERTDRSVLTAARAGLTVSPTVLQAPPWARKNPDRTWSPPADPDDYAKYAGALVRRYGPQGTFWAAHPGVARRPIRAWQIWNEPVGGDKDNGRSAFWDDDEPFQARFIALMRAARTAIKREDPGATVILGALVGVSWRTLGNLYDRGVKGSFDAIALHPYTAKPVNVVRIVDLVRRVMRKHGDGAKTVYLSEVGWPPFDGASVHRLGVREAAAAQGAWLRETFARLLSARKRLRIQQLLWYTWIGTDSSKEDAFDYSGLLRLGPSGRLTAKPALARFRAFSRRLRPVRAR